MMNAVTVRATLIALLSSLSWAAFAVEDAPRDIDIPAGELSDALIQLSKRYGIDLFYRPEQVRGIKTQGAHGELTTEQAIAYLIKGTSLKLSTDESGAMVIGLPESTVSKTTSTAGSSVQTSKLSLAQDNSTGAGLQTMESAAEHSQTNDSPQPRDISEKIQEIVVTAQKRAERLQDVPMSITALSGEELNRRGIVSTVDIALSVPGVAVQDRGGATRSRYIFMRGLGNTFGEIAMVGVYLDEQDITGFPYYALDIRGYDLHQIEALRGPQGTLYGSGAMGGVLKYVTNEVDLSSTSGDTYVTASSTQDGSISEKIGGALNLPIVADKFGLRLAGFYEDSAGWIDQPALSKSDINDEETYSFRAKARWTPADSLEVAAMAMVQRNDTGGPNVGEDDNGNFNQQFGRATTPSGSSEFETYNLTAKLSLGSAQIVSSTGYFAADTSIQEAGYILPVFAAPTAPFQVLFLNDDISSKSFTQELRVSSVNSQFFNWSTGVSYRRADFKESGQYLFAQALPASTVIQGPFDKGTRAWAVFGEGSLNLTERLNLGAGLRYFEDEQINRILNSSGVLQSTQSAKFDQLSPRFFATFAVTDDIKLYANIAKGFRSGGFNTPAVVAVGAPPTYESDIVWSYELGGKGRLFSNRMSFDVAAFYSDYTDVQDNGAVLINGVVRSVAGNLGTAAINGVDWDFALQVSPGLSIGTGGEYLFKDEYTQITAVRSSVAVGDSLKQIPTYHVGAWGEYEFGPWLSGDSGYFRIDYNKQGQATYRNRNANGATPFYFSVSDKIDMLNAAIGWEKNVWEVSVFGRNLLDDRGYIDGESLELLAARSRPRTFGVNLRVRFD